MISPDPSDATSLPPADQAIASIFWPAARAAADAGAVIAGAARPKAFEWLGEFSTANETMMPFDVVICDLILLAGAFNWRERTEP